MAKKKAKKKKASAKKPTKKTITADTYMSDEDPDEQEVVLITGEIGSGKTYAFLTASQFMPTNKNGPVFPAPKRTVLEDLFMIQADRKAVAGAKGDKLALQVFDVVRYMVEHDCNILTAQDAAVDAAYKFVDEYGVGARIGVDTISKLDEKTINHFRQNPTDASNYWGCYQDNYYNHIDFYDQLVGTGAHIFFLCHLKTRKEEDGDTASVVKIATGGKRVPAIVGQGEGVYKRDGVLQIAIHAHAEKVRGKLITKRRAIFGLNDMGYETKNRYERTLLKQWPDGVQDPIDMGFLLEVAGG